MVPVRALGNGTYRAARVSTADPYASTLVAWRRGHPLQHGRSRSKTSAPSFARCGITASRRISDADKAFSPRNRCRVRGHRRRVWRTATGTTDRNAVTPASGVDRANAIDRGNAIDGGNADDSGRRRSKSTGAMSGRWRGICEASRADVRGTRRVISIHGISNERVAEQPVCIVWRTDECFGTV